ncbi:hypothetical protein MWH28_06680 [Natroniella sulfidigena]|uniref:hypothetical protein n=1 Tax=Natroniella sulfidigena TaxID=723921 RepID=UPI00200AABFA|nr:hypothetical protein [Natroniella sulfidigena]MCK8817057.1 hypothetical protein [Natroniella sulfidigena]
MLDECQPCDCKPYENKCCCPEQNGIFIAQPKCQRLPDGRVVNNPCFVQEENSSFWSYKVVTNCDPATRGISSIAIPICEVIHEAHIRVEEKIDGCDEFKEIDTFELRKTDPIFGEAPEGFQFLKIETDDRYDTGVAVLYRIEITGNYPTAIQPLAVKAGPPVLLFDCSCYQVPACPPMPRLFIEKDCEVVIDDNQATLNYTATVSNVGDTNFANVQFRDQITYDAANITFGEIIVDPDLDIEEVEPGVIVISGSLGPLARGEITTVTVEIPVVSIVDPNRYLIRNMVTASAQGIEATDSCILFLDAVQLAADKCCLQGPTVDANIFRIIVDNVGHSPQTDITIIDTLVVPQEVTVQFTSFDGCDAFFVDDGNPVPLNTDISGRAINIICEELTVAQGGTVIKDIQFNVVATRAFVEPVRIINSLQDIIFLNQDQQILLGIDNLPVTARIAVVGELDCEDPCQP